MNVAIMETKEILSIIREEIVFSVITSFASDTEHHSHLGP